MRAIVSTAYGSPEVFQLQEVEKPTPGDNEVLIKMRAAAATPADSAFRKGEPFIVRLIYGLNKPRLKISGVELAGDIEAVGKDVTEFKAGDRVYGMSPNTFGAYADYNCVAEKVPLIVLPDSINYDEAVGLCDGGTTALTFLRDVGKIQSGQKVLINGASGAVGVYGVQLASHFGADVTGVCSTRNIEMVQSLGANHVIDYTQQDFTQTGQAYDLIFDAVGKSSFVKCQKMLTTNGVYMTTVPTLGIVYQVLRTRLMSSKKAKFSTAGLMQNKDNLRFLVELFEAGKIRAVLDRHFPLEDVAAAHTYVDTERKRGNVIITFDTES